MAITIKVKNRCQVTKISRTGKAPIVYLKCFGKKRDKKSQKEMTAQQILDETEYKIKG